MIRLHLQRLRQLSSIPGAIMFALSLLVMCDTSLTWAQLAPNQTNGFGNNRVVTFTYLQNFDCVDQPTMDLDFNKVKAQSDPNEMQTPICQAVTEPTQDPAGSNIKHTAHLYVFLPMFSVDNDQNPNDAMPCPNGGRPGELCGPALGAALIKAFGFLRRLGRHTRWSRHSAPIPTILYRAHAQCMLLLSTCP